MYYCIDASCNFFCIRCSHKSQPQKAELCLRTSTTVMIVQHSVSFVLYYALRECLRTKDYCEALYTGARIKIIRSQYFFDTFCSNTG